MKFYVMTEDAIMPCSLVYYTWNMAISISF